MAADQDEALEGCYVLRTDRTDLSDQEIWQTYMMLTRVERAFRSLKSSLGLRPNFHQTEQRADAHLFISVLAYHILHIIEHRLRQQGDHRCWQTICRNLSTHQRLTIEYNVKEQQETQRLPLADMQQPGTGASADLPPSWPIRQPAWPSHLCRKMSSDHNRPGRATAPYKFSQIFPKIPKDASKIYCIINMLKLCSF